MIRDTLGTQMGSCLGRNGFVSGETSAVCANNSSFFFNFQIEIAAKKRESYIFWLFLSVLYFYL